MSLTRRDLLRAGGIAAGAAFLSACAPATPAAAAASTPAPARRTFEVTYDDAQWRQRLSPSQYAVLRQQATERPFSSPLNDEHRRGTFACAGCALPLFSSATKFDSGTGWPSFWQPLPAAVGEDSDVAFGMRRTEVHCSRCGGHLGHVFDDGPQPTGLRYCMNGVAMTFAAA